MWVPIGSAGPNRGRREILALNSVILTFNYETLFQTKRLSYLRMPGKTNSIFPVFLSGAEEALTP